MDLVAKDDTYDYTSFSFLNAVVNHFTLFYHRIETTRELGRYTRQIIKAEECDGNYIDRTITISHMKI